jgi:hypothetical protein
MALDQSLTLKLWTHDCGKEMLAITLHLNVRTDNALLNIFFNLGWGWEHRDLLITGNYS